MTAPCEVAIVGAGGLVGQRVAAALGARGLGVTLVGRRRDGLAAVQTGLLGDAPIRIADATDAAAITAAVAGARLVINAAGPLRETAACVLGAAIAVGAAYVDVGGEQATLRDLYEQQESAVRHAGLVAVPGVGLDGTLGDLAAMLAAAHLEASPARPLGELVVTYVFDELVLSAGSQRALFAAAFARPLVWRRDRWERAATGAHRIVDAGAAFGGDRDALAYAGGSVITLPRHVPAQLVATYASTTRRRSGLMRLVASALPLVPRAASVLAAYAPPDADYARTRFAVIAQARRGAETAHVIVRGHDVYATTAAITAELVMHLLDRGAGPIGLRAPGELLDAATVLRRIADRAHLAIETSFVV